MYSIKLLNIFFNYADALHYCILMNKKYIIAVTQKARHMKTFICIKIYYLY